MDHLDFDFHEGEIISIGGASGSGKTTLAKIILGLFNWNHVQAIFFIAHDLELAYYVSDSILIMSEGKIIERGKAEDIIEHPSSDYTRSLLADVPKLNEEAKLS